MCRFSWWLVSWLVTCSLEEMHETGEVSTCHSHLQLRDGDAAVVGGKMVAITPGAADELGALDDNLGQLDALGGWNATGDDVDAGVEAKDEPGVVAVGDKVATGQQHLARCRHGGCWVSCGVDGHGRAGLSFLVQVLVGGGLQDEAPRRAH
jgi:hypothetical protein